MTRWPKTFKQAFCERYRCVESQYLRRAFTKCLFRRALPIAPFLLTLWPEFFRVDLDAIERIGAAQSWQELNSELNAFSYNSRLRSRPLRSQLRLRISGNRIRRLANLLFANIDLEPASK